MSPRRLRIGGTGPSRSPQKRVVRLRVDRRARALTSSGLVSCARLTSGRAAGGVGVQTPASASPDIVHRVESRPDLRHVDAAQASPTSSVVSTTTSASD